MYALLFVGFLHKDYRSNNVPPEISVGLVNLGVLDRAADDAGFVFDFAAARGGGGFQNSAGRFDYVSPIISTVSKHAGRVIEEHRSQSYSAGRFL